MKSLPIGVDLGATRVRIARCEVVDGAPVLVAAAGRDLTEAPAAETNPDGARIAALIDEMLEEIGTRERRVVCCISDAAAAVRTIRFPPMSWRDRLRAAAFEMAPGLDYPLEEALVRVHPMPGRPHHYCVGAVRRERLHERVSALRGAGLRVVAVDYEAFALTRSLSEYDVVLDVGARRSSCYRVEPVSTRSARLPLGGFDVTRAIGRDLRIEPRAAERRKRVVGTAGAGESGRAELTAGLVGLLNAVGASDERTSVALCGNGSRLNDLASDVSRASGLRVEVGVSAAARRSAYPSDVVRAAAQDMNLAIGLSTWGWNS